MPFIFHLPQGGSEKFYFIMTMVAVTEWHKVRFLNFGVLLYTWHRTTHVQEATVYLFPTLLQWYHFGSLQLHGGGYLHHRNWQMSKIRHLLTNPTSTPPPPKPHTPCLENQTVKHLPAHYCTELNLEHILTQTLLIL